MPRVTTPVRPRDRTPEADRAADALLTVEVAVALAVEDREAEQRGRVAEWIHESGLRVGDQQHVRFVDGGPAANRAAVNAVTVFEGFFVQFADGITDVVPEPGEVGESEVDDFCVVLFAKLQNGFCVQFSSGVVCLRRVLL